MANYIVPSFEHFPHSLYSFAHAQFQKLENQKVNLIGKQLLVLKNHIYQEITWRFLGIQILKKEGFKRFDFLKKIFDVLSVCCFFVYVFFTLNFSQGGHGDPDNPLDQLEVSLKQFARRVPLKSIA